MVLPFSPAYTRQGRNVRVSNFFILVGPSGSGKTTCIQKLLQRHPDKLVFPLTHTTRLPRGGESHGRDMYFVSRAEWVAASTANEFIATTEYGGHLYGTKTSDIRTPLEAHKKVVVAFDHFGVECVQAAGLGAITIFLRPQSLDQLRSNLAKRWPEGGHVLEARVDKARTEIAMSHLHVYDYVVESTTIPEMVAALEAIMVLK